jgi:AcrR family transcriptional regulator
MSEPKTEGMRERTRRIIRTELTQVAQDLFVKNGYEATTVDQIASAAGMSKRTFFRYFASKEDLVIGKYDLLEELMVESFKARPNDEPLWEALRRVLDIGVNYFSNPNTTLRAEEMDRTVRSSPALYARYLERFSRLQASLAEIAQKRGNYEPLSPKTRAIVGAAFACFVAAQEIWYKSNKSKDLGDLLDEAMTSLRM